MSFRRPVAAAIIVLVALVVGLLGVAGTAAQTINMDAAQAQEEFRWGVLAYHAGRFADSIVAFTRALSFQPEDMVAREWLGRAYFRSGFEDAALAEWETVADEGAAGAYLRSRIETLRYRRGALLLNQGELRLVRSQQLTGGGAASAPFNRPVGMAADRYGDVYIVSLGSQDIARLSPNGTVRVRLQGGLQGIDRPFDIAHFGGELFIAEFGADRIARFATSGARIDAFGEQGVAPGQLMGPQYLAVDGDGFIYVSEWGTRRVSKFDREGVFVQTIGTPNPVFEGLQRPTGIAVDDDTILVVDHDRDGVALQRFDLFGNHIERIALPLGAGDLPESSISGVTVEDLAWYDATTLLVAAGRRVLLFDPSREAIVAEIEEQQAERVSAAVVDANGRVVVSDFDANTVGIYEPEGTLYSGLDVRIERIITRDRPRIGVLVAVHDRNGAPVVGLDDANFTISENGIPMIEASVESAGNAVQTGTLATILMPGVAPSHVRDAGQAAFDIAALFDSAFDVSFSVAGSELLPVIDLPATPERVQQASVETLSGVGGLAATGSAALDRALRLAAGSLFTAGLRRDIVLVTDGVIGDTAFRELGLQESGALLRNNGIRLHLVMTVPGAPAAELSFLVEQTGGTTRYLYEPQGLRPLREEILSDPSGRYWITYGSQAQSDFGRAYQVVSAEARLFVRSGRDELGFFFTE